MKSVAEAPEIPEENIENKQADLGRIQDICSTLVSRVVDGKPGITNEDLAWIKETRKDYASLRSIYAQRRKGRKISKSKLSNLESKGLTPESVPEIDAIISKEFLEALEHTFSFIDATDAMSARDRSRQGLDYAKVATKANIEFADFFIKAHKELGLSDEQTHSLFDNIFFKSGIDRELEIKGLGHFPGGILAVIKAYLHLSKENPELDFFVPTRNVELDMNHSVDLIGRNGSINYYEIKGRKSTNNLEIDEITSEEQLDKVRKKILLNKQARDSTIMLTSIYKLHEYVAGQRKGKEPEARGFLVEVPSK